MTFSSVPKSLWNYFISVVQNTTHQEIQCSSQHSLSYVLTLFLAPCILGLRNISLQKVNRRSSRTSKTVVTSQSPVSFTFLFKGIECKSSHSRPLQVPSATGRWCAKSGLNKIKFIWKRVLLLSVGNVQLPVWCSLSCNGLCKLYIFL